MLKRAVEHVGMVAVQHELYIKHADNVVNNVNKSHPEWLYCFVVDYGHNMQLPTFKGEQPGPVYYYSPITVLNLGMVDHAHVYPDGEVGAHMYTHVYHEGVGKKGSNNVASLIMKTLHHINLLWEDEMGRELTIVFYNCQG